MIRQSLAQPESECGSERRRRPVFWKDDGGELRACAGTRKSYPEWVLIKVGCEGSARNLETEQGTDIRASRPRYLSFTRWSFHRRLSFSSFLRGSCQSQSHCYLSGATTAWNSNSTIRAIKPRAEGAQQDCYYFPSPSAFPARLLAQRCRGPSSSRHVTFRRCSTFVLRGQQQNVAGHSGGILTRWLAALLLFQTILADAWVCKINL